MCVFFTSIERHHIIKSKSCFSTEFNLLCFDSLVSPPSTASDYFLCFLFPLQYRIRHFFSLNTLQTKLHFSPNFSSFAWAESAHNCWVQRFECWKLEIVVVNFDGMMFSEWLGKWILWAKNITGGFCFGCNLLYHCWVFLFRLVEFVKFLRWI